MNDHGLPPVPAVDGERLVALAAAQSVAAAAFDQAPAPVRAMAGPWLTDRGVAGLAALTPSLADGDAPRLLPAPRAFLSEADRARLDGVAAGLGHVEARRRAVAVGEGARRLAPETPFVLHALTEGRRPAPDGSAPGLVRRATTAWRDSSTGYRHPDPEVAAAALAEAVEVAACGGEPGAVAGGWLAFTVLSLHPFTDGNGRTARLLHLLLVDGPGPVSCLVGVAEQVAADRRGYLAALQAGQRSARLDELDAEPFVALLVGASIAGAAVTARRLAVLAEVDERVQAAVTGLDDGHRAVVLRVWAERVLAPEQLPGATGPNRQLLEELAGAGVAERLALAPSRRRPGWRGIGYRLAPALVDALGPPGALLT